MNGVVRDGTRAIARTMELERNSQIRIIAVRASFVPDRILYAAATLESGSNPKCLNC